MGKSTINVSLPEGNHYALKKGHGKAMWCFEVVAHSGCHVVKAAAPGWMGEWPLGHTTGRDGAWAPKHLGSGK